MQSPRKVHVRPTLQRSGPSRILSGMSQTIDSIRGEFHRYRRMLELAVEQTSTDDLFLAPDEVTNSIAIVIGHLTGNLHSRFTDFLTTDGEKPWRARDAEFEDPLELGRDELLAQMSAGWDVLDAALDDVLASDALGATVTIRGLPLTVIEALHRSLAHVAYHVGQIVQTARSMVGAEWKTLSIAKGGSAAGLRN